MCRSLSMATRWVATAVTRAAQACSATAVPVATAVQPLRTGTAAGRARWARQRAAMAAPAAGVVCWWAAAVPAATHSQARYSAPSAQRPRVTAAPVVIPPLVPAVPAGSAAWVPRPTPATMVWARQVQARRSAVPAGAAARCCSSAPVGQAGTRTSHSAATARSTSAMAWRSPGAAATAAAAASSGPCSPAARAVPAVPVARQAPTGRRPPVMVVMAVGARSAAGVAPVVRVARPPR